ncbi:thiosulfate sulfurtransferase GlpE [Glaciecola siphonariae]|uniref:Thiosulfate sulfurtransferase GlpE n=1 Tax=Glaciecola siphonariae TaxID=521012 RepID=A0ABV9LYJ2_9ALTE
MEQFQHISPADTKTRLDNNEIKVVDIRDEQSFALGRIPGAYHLTNASMTKFVQDSDVNVPVVVCCYHGISSQQAAQYIIHQGFKEVYSMDGGFEAWRANYPFDSGEEK